MISITIPVYNGARFLPAALATIAAQDLLDREVLVIDDGSTDGLTVPASVRYIRKAHQGPSAARNRGIREARGDELAFLDVDDEWTPGHLSRLHAALVANPGAGVAQGRMRQRAGDRISAAYRMPYIGSCLFRRQVFDLCGGFDETMTLGEDYDLMLRCWEHDVPKVNVEDVSLIYRRHDGNLTRGRHVSSHTIVLQRRLERIRAGRLDPHEGRRFSFEHYIGDTDGAAEWSTLSAL